jgi:transposase-like protein
MGRLNRSSASEKYELIRLVEESKLPIKRTLTEIGLPRSTFYRWYEAYQREGLAGLEDHSSQPRQFWNRIPETVREQVVQIALQRAELSPRELAWHITDNEGYFISESSVYRILKSFDLITSPAFILVKAASKYKQPTKRVNEMWQTDFSLFRIKGWYDTRPTVNRIAQDRAQNIHEDDLFAEANARIKAVKPPRDGFNAAHVVPQSSADIADEARARVVVLSPDMVYKKGNGTSKAQVAAQDILENRGNSPRLYRNMLVSQQDENAW